MSTAVTRDAGTEFVFTGGFVSIVDPCYEDTLGFGGLVLDVQVLMPAGTYTFQQTAPGCVLVGERTNDRRLAGAFSVDSGQFMISSDNFADEYRQHGLDNSDDLDFTKLNPVADTDFLDYDFICQVTLSEESSRMFTSEDGSVFLSGTAYGDGTYAVMIYLNSVGETVGFEIDTENDFASDECWDCGARPGDCSC